MMDMRLPLPGRRDAATLPVGPKASTGWHKCRRVQPLGDWAGAGGYSLKP